MFGASRSCLALSALEPCVGACVLRRIWFYSCTWSKRCAQMGFISIVCASTAAYARPRTLGLERFLTRVGILLSLLVIPTTYYTRRARYSALAQFAHSKPRVIMRQVSLPGGASLSLPLGGGSVDLGRVHCVGDSSKFVSRRQCSISSRGKDLVITSLGTKNPTGIRSPGVPAVTAWTWLEQGSVHTIADGAGVDIALARDNCGSLFKVPAMMIANATAHSRSRIWSGFIQPRGTCARRRTPRAA